MREDFPSAPDAASLCADEALALGFKKGIKSDGRDAPCFSRTALSFACLPRITGVFSYALVCAVAMAPGRAAAAAPRALPPAASPPTQSEAAIDPKTESNRHFEFGIKLYEDKNTLAALAEFEAAYWQYPSAAALQNIALCQKQLYRYLDARESLARLLRDHGAELNHADRLSVEQAMAELGALIGSVRLSVAPANAEVVLDGRTLSPDEVQQPIVVDVGEHRVVASAPGFAPALRSFRIAGGHQDVPIALRLQEVTGVVVIKAADEQTAIAIDGRPVAFADWTGRLEPGRHFIQIYREGYEPFEQELDVEAGKTVH
ncbi:MAG TPA: PEGA domain-containing protein, partial [Polyangiaceae bacterium]